MIQEQIKTLENIVDKEIDGYKKIEKLYTDKKEILIHAKSTELFSVDEEIKNVYKNINGCCEERKRISKSLIHITLFPRGLRAKKSPSF